MRSLIEIKNFGPKMVEWLNKIDIHDEADLLNSDYKTIKEKLIQAGITPHILMFYSIEMGLQDRKWNDISPTEKQELKRILGM
jgi:hypothetical protein